MADFTGPAGGSRTHVVSETGLAVWLDGDGLAGRAQVVPQLHVPGTDVLRASVLAAWADILTGLLAMSVLTAAVPVTLDLSLDVVAPLHGCPVIEARSWVVKAGRSVVALAVEFTVAGSREPVAISSGTFMASPNPDFVLPPLTETVRPMAVPGGPLREPFADRAGCQRRGVASAVLPRRDDGLNATNTVNGALLALVAEEAVLTAADPGAVLSSLRMRYVRPARTGPVVATAERFGSLYRVGVRDEGQANRLAVEVTARTST